MFILLLCLSFCSSLWQDTQLLPPDFYSAPPSSRIILFCHNSAKKWYVYHLVLLAIVDCIDIRKTNFSPKVFFGKCMNCVVQDKKCSLVSNSQYHMCSSWHCLTVANCWPPPHTIIRISAGDDVLINYKCGRQMSRLISTPLTPVHAPLSPMIADCGSSVSPDRDQAAGRLLETRASNGGSRRFHNYLLHTGWKHLLVLMKVMRDGWSG